MIGDAWRRLRDALARLLPWGGDLTPPDWTAGRPRILLVGPTGAGKSTLVNAVLGTDGAAAASGAPVTQGTAWHGQGAAWPVALADTRGLEMAESAAQVAAFRRALDDLGPERRPHLVWLVLNAEGGRAHGGAGTLSALAEGLRGAGIPALVVLTHAEPGAEAHARLRARIAEVMGPVPVVPVNSRATVGEDGTVLVPPHGLDALRDASEALLPGTRGRGADR